MQKTYRRNYAQAVAGQTDGLGLPRVHTYENTALSTYETWSIAIPAVPGSSTTFTVTVNGKTASTTTDASATQAELETQLLSALRLSEVYDVANISLDTVAHTLTLTAREQSVAIAVTTTGTGLTATKTVPASKSTLVPYGRFVGRLTSYPLGVVSLVTSSAHKVKGIAILTYANEKVGIGQAAVDGYQPTDAMDILDRANSTDGTWVECIEPDITEDDSVYVSYAAGNEGKVTKSATNAIAVARASFSERVKVDPNGKTIARVSLNFD